MAWFKVDDEVTFHRKTLTAGNEAFGAWIRMGAWSSRELTDGLLPRAVAEQIAGSMPLLDRLVSVGFLERSGDDFLVHDYHEYNPAAAVVRKGRDQRAKAGARGARNRWHADSGTPSESSISDSEMHGKPLSAARSPPQRRNGEMHGEPPSDSEMHGKSPSKTAQIDGEMHGSWDPDPDPGSRIPGSRIPGSQEPWVVELRDRGSIWRNGSPWLAVPWAKSPEFQEAAALYPNSSDAMTAAQVWAAISTVRPGGEGALLNAFKARWASQRSEVYFRRERDKICSFAVYLAKRRWEDPQESGAAPTATPRVRDLDAELRADDIRLKAEWAKSGPLKARKVADLLREEAEAAQGQKA